MNQNNSKKIDKKISLLESVLFAQNNNKNGSTSNGNDKTQSVDFHTNQ